MDYTSADLEEYEKRARSGPCFICELVRDNPNYAHHVVFEDDDFIAFLDKYPTVQGKTIVAPKRHVEHVVSDLTETEFQRTMTVVYRIASAVEATVPTERLYLLSLGSQEGNRHLHWHIAPLPPGIPYQQQQFHALMLENGILPSNQEELADLAHRITARLRTEPT